MSSYSTDPSLMKGPPPAYEQSNTSVGASRPNSSGPMFASFQSKYGCVALSLMDRIRFVNIPHEDITNVQDAVNAAWSKGIQDTRLFGATYELKLKGNPWNGVTRSKHIVECKRLVMAVLQTLFDRGWVLKAAVDVGQNQQDRDSMFFRRQYPPPPPRAWGAISFHSGDRMMLIDFPPEVYQSLIQALGPRAQKSEPVESFSSVAFDIKLKGWPWRVVNEEMAEMRIILVTLLDVLETHGFDLYTSAALPGPGAEGRHSDAWYCCRAKGWVPGQPL